MKRYLVATFALLVIIVAVVLGAGAKAASRPLSPSLTPTATPTATPCSLLTSWSVAQPLTAPVGAPAVSSDGTFIYAADGYDYQAGHTEAQFARYDPTANTWISLTNAPDVFYGASAVYAPNVGKLYVFGGFPGNSVPLTTTRIYDPIANSWSSGAPMPDSRGGMGAAYGSGKIFLLGGQGVGMSINGQNWAYDPVANSWLTMTALPAARVGLAVGVISGQLYAAGGLDSSFLEDNTLFDYNIASDTWSNRANMPIGDFGAGGIAAAGKLYVIGGGFPTTYGAGITTVRNVTLIYDPATNSWSNGPLLNQGRSFQGAAAAGNHLVVVGGDISSNVATNSVEVASLVSCPTATPTATASPMPTNTQTSTATATASPMPTNAQTSTATATASAAPTNTPANPTSTPPANTPQPTDTTTPLPGTTPTDCANPFADISGNVFYSAIHYLNCRGVINGTDSTHYSPAGTSTRGQFAKVVVLGFGTPPYTPGTPDFSDVPPTYFAYLYIESGFHAAILSGFDQASCAAHGVGFPCYLPNLAITRGQLTKLVVAAAHYPLITPVSGPTFIDVPPSNVFYVSIETAHNKGVINGYTDGSFRPNNNIRRDEMAQIVYKGVTTP